MPSSQRLKEYCEEYYRMRARYSKRCSGLQLHLTNRCQNQCLGCYQRRRENNPTVLDIPLEHATKIIGCFVGNARQEGKIPIVDLIGGDPLLYPHFFDLLYYLKKNRIKYGIRGNPHMLDNAMIRDLKRAGAERYHLSLDGMEKLHDRHRNFPGLFKKTVQSIDELSKKNIAVVIRYTLSEVNADDLVDLQKFIGSNRYDCYLSVARFVDASHKNQMVSITTLIDILTKSAEIFSRFIEASRLDYGYKVLFKDHIYLPLLHQKGLVSDKFINSALRYKWSTKCSMYENYTIIDVDGNLKLCQKHPCSIVGNVLKDKTMFSSRKKHNLAGQFICSNCFYRELCFGCPAYVATLGKDECPFWRKRNE